MPVRMDHRRDRQGRCDYHSGRGGFMMAGDGFLVVACGAVS